jgi:hypothetical protein
MDKEYHIVYGETAKNSLVQYTHIDFIGDDVELIVLEDNLTEGPLYNLTSLEGLNKRIEWIDHFYEGKDIYTYREDDIFEIQQKLNKVDSNDKVFIWLGNEGNEYIWKCALLNSFGQINPIIYVIDWSKIVFYNIQNEQISTYSVNVSSATNINIAFQNFRHLTEEEKNTYSDLWVIYLKNNSQLRVLSNVSTLLETTMDYFDNILISECTTEFQRSVIVVAKTFGVLFAKKYYCGIGDHFLIQRLKQLCYEGKLQMRNQEHGQRNGHIFEVSLKEL